jgi:tetratricopeptide (TPR) repeat protein
MSSTREAIERALFVGRWDDEIATGGSEDSVTATLTKDVIDGSFRSVLTSDHAQRILKIKPALEHLDGPVTSWFDFDSIPEEDRNSLLPLIVGIACLHSYVQPNYTGPDLDVKPLEVLKFSPNLDVTEETLHQRATTELAYGGEPAYHLAQVPIFLAVAEALWSVAETAKTVVWWKLRTWLLREEILDEPVGLPQELWDAYAFFVPPLLYPLIFRRTIADADALKDPEFPPDLREVQGRILLEQGLLNHTLQNDKPAAERFVRAAKANGLRYELTGALGKRTKFQQFDVTQLVLLARSRKTPEDKNKIEEEGIKPEEVNPTPGAAGGPAVPETLLLNDDTLLEKTEFTSSTPSSSSAISDLDPNSQPPLDPLDQCILLGLCLNVKNTSPSHGLTAEQMSPYVARVISHPLNWLVHTMALLLRSRLESNRTRTVERSTLQLQALVDQMPTADSTIQERLEYFHGISLPSKWEMQKELATRFLSIGVVKSALEVFEKLEMWEHVVQCWQSMERPDKGIAIVKDLLEGRKAEADVVLSRGRASRTTKLDVVREAKLWCLLGDMEPANAVHHYTHAWEISNHTSTRAVRSLGGYHFARGEYGEAKDCLKKAVVINPLLSRSWFILGCACLKIEDWEEARQAFFRCVTIDDEDAESWSNLASVYLRMAEVGQDQPGGEVRISSHSACNTLLDVEYSTVLQGDREGGEVVPFTHRMLAWRALKQGVKHSYDNWRMWMNYMIVSMDVGELTEACRAFVRIVECRADKDGSSAVDEDVLDKLVDAATRSVAQVETESSGAQQQSSWSPKELLKRVTELLDNTILPRVATTRVYRARARLYTFHADYESAIRLYMDAYRLGVAGSMEKGEADVDSWRVAVTEVEEIVDVLRNFGPKIEGYKWGLQARSIVRSFMGKMREDFEDEPEWQRLIDLTEELKS